MIKCNYIKFEQPAGTFYLSKMTPKEIKSISKVETRAHSGGPQREASTKRKAEIANYCKDPDATFPTPIILSINSEYIKNFNATSFEIQKSEEIASILDGQHRVAGILASEHIDDFELPVVIVMDLTEEEKAYIFSIINSKQTKVPPSLIYDLFDVSTYRSPQRTCHEIARSFNSDSDSPFYERLKMLGKGGGELASISQGSFIKSLLKLITNKPEIYAINIKNNVELIPENRPFNKYFREEKDDVIRKILMNLFNAVRKVFPVEWEQPDKYILSKSIGCGALLKAYPKIHELGQKNKTLSLDFFTEIMKKLKVELELNNLELTSRHFSSNEQSINRLAQLIKTVVERELGSMQET
ncbi:DGQHR domain-containing protein [Pseudoalteromonas sp. SCSIO 43095]|uniref:DGQHR domain-containing protein n=1 Tax=Pseudoalteromonas sp. SCSIO 43095 TaxID=2894202 RepID=UPI00202AE306|nr:DGQHR domain-containing protein [Pseudoalteromonas sp. SCSIO 43095]URR00627.1 DGQHR domain-containing protein [Pseudoalteromonas sp. SCSIO 43095]